MSDSVNLAFYQNLIRDSEAAVERATLGMDGEVRKSDARIHQELLLAQALGTVALAEAVRRVAVVLHRIEDGFERRWAGV